jgi:hypothetical protein
MVAIVHHTIYTKSYNIKYYKYFFLEDYFYGYFWIKRWNGTSRSKWSRKYFWIQVEHQEVQDQVEHQESSKNIGSSEIRVDHLEIPEIVRIAGVLGPEIK